MTWKYEHLEELAERFFAAKRRHVRRHSPAALNTHSFGLPVIATEVGSLRNDIMEAKTGFLCRAKNPAELTRTIRAYFASDLYENLEQHRSQIREFGQGWGGFWMGFIEGCLRNKWSQQRK